MKTDKQTTMYQWAKDYDQQLLPTSLINDIDEFLDKTIHGQEIGQDFAPYLKRRIMQERDKHFSC